MILTLALVGALVPPSGFAQGKIVAVSATPAGAARITLSDGRKIEVTKERDQTGISDAHVASDGTVGWLAEFRVETVPYPIPLRLIIWRDRIIRRFETGQAFYSWTFYAQGKQVAYHTGPLHGERRSHCELRDVASGRTIAVWDGDLGSDSNRPAWTRGLPR